MPGMDSNDERMTLREDELVTITVHQSTVRLAIEALNHLDPVIATFTAQIRRAKSELEAARRDAISKEASNE